MYLFRSDDTVHSVPAFMWEIDRKRAVPLSTGRGCSSTVEHVHVYSVPFLVHSTLSMMLPARINAFSSAVPSRPKKTPIRQQQQQQQRASTFVLNVLLQRAMLSEDPASSSDDPNNNNNSNDNNEPTTSALEAYGAAAITLELISSTALFLAREPFRVALARSRVPTDAAADATAGGGGGGGAGDSGCRREAYRRRFVNTAWVAAPVGLAFAVFVRLAYRWVIPNDAFDGVGENRQVYWVASEIG